MIAACSPSTWTKSRRTLTTNRPFSDEWVFDITVRDDKAARIQEYIDTQALAQASSHPAEHDEKRPEDQSDLRAS